MNKNFEHDILTEAEDVIINGFGRVFDEMGAKLIFGRTMGLLITQNKPISLKEISSRLKVTKSAIITNMKFIENKYLFKKVYNPERPREDFYEINLDFHDMTINSHIEQMEFFLNIIEKSKQLIEKNKDNSQENLKNPDKLRDIAILVKRLNYLKKVFETIKDAFIDLDDRVRASIEQIKYEE